MNIKVNAQIAFKVWWQSTLIFFCCILFLKLVIIQGRYVEPFDYWLFLLAPLPFTFIGFCMSCYFDSRETKGG